MYAALSPGASGVKVSNLAESLSAAIKGGFRGVEVSPEEIADLPTNEVLDTFASKELYVAGFGLPLDWRGDEGTYQSSLKELPRLASACAGIGATRCATWILPMSNDREFGANFEFHRSRLSPAAAILADHGISFGMEYIGPKTMRDTGKFPFIWTQDGMLELAHAIGPNVGLLVDSWHWYTSHATLEDLKRLELKDIVYVHVNDAPAGLEIDSQVDNVRSLPAETGVIDIRGFLDVLSGIGYSGPVIPEPFKKELSELPSDAKRLEVVGASMRAIGL
jgi:sugar phosphate isomerase/epimerase